MSFCLFLVTVIVTLIKTGFLHWPSLQGQPSKVFEFPKAEKVLELFLEKEWKALKSFYLSKGKASTRLDDCTNFLS